MVDAAESARGRVAGRGGLSPSRPTADVRLHGPPMRPHTNP